ncbi:MAG: hypothetical protein Q8K43_02465, partial [Sulfurimicrobium sp.]|nr:hypothetical protein [Sulfurimicrobium sp.]
MPLLDRPNFDSSGLILQHGFHIFDHECRFWGFIEACPLTRFETTAERMHVAPHGPRGLSEHPPKVRNRQAGVPDAKAD